MQHMAIEIPERLLGGGEIITSPDGETLTEGFIHRRTDRHRFQITAAGKYSWPDARGVVGR